MFKSVEEAIEALKKRRSGDEYLAACEYLVEHRADLKARVFIEIPGGLTGNTETRWDKVREGSNERCSCGNERVILPLNPRQDFKAGKERLVVNANPVYIKPVGGDKASALMEIKVEKGAFVFFKDPFAPFVMSMDMFRTPGYLLDKLAEVLPKQPTPPVMFSELEKGIRTPVFAIEAVNLEAQTLTIVMDEDMEAFNPDLLADHACPV